MPVIISQISDPGLTGWWDTVKDPEVLFEVSKRTAGFAAKKATGKKITEVVHSMPEYDAGSFGRGWLWLGGGVLAAAVLIAFVARR